MQALESLQTANRLVPESRRVLGRTSIGVATRAGAEKPNIATPQGFKQALLAARSLALSDPAVGGSAGIYLRGLLDRMGLAEAMGGKTRLQPSGAAVAESVARGEVDIGMTFISEMLPVTGISIVGPLPPPLGNDTTYAAAVPISCTDPGSALAFIATLTRPERRNVWNASGFELASRPDVRPVPAP
jgi:molybdate transport system substrate-binding protein